MRVKAASIGTALMLCCVTILLHGQTAVINGWGGGSSSSLTTSLAIGSTTFVAPPSGGADATAMLQAALTASKDVYLSTGTYTVRPANHSGNIYALLVLDGQHVSGPGIVKLADSAGDYNAIFYSNTCIGCQFKGFTVDSNIDNNPISSAGILNTRPRHEFDIFGGNVSFDGLTIKNSSSFNAINVQVASQSTGPTSVTNCTLLNFGDDPNHIVHDISPIMISALSGGGGIVLANNKVFASSFNAPSAGDGTCYETHGGMQTVTGNTCWGFGRGIDVTGVDLEDTESNTISGNSMVVAFIGITLWSETFSTHTTGNGLSNTAITGNAITIHQSGITNASLYPAGISIEPSANLPIDNLLINGNVIKFDLEGSSQTANSLEAGIGLNPGQALVASNVKITGNIIENSPVAGISWSGATVDLDISGNTIVNAGSSLDGSLTASYKIPIWLDFTAGAANISVNRNQIIDNLATSRMTYSTFLTCAASLDMRMLDNTVELSGATTTSWLAYFFILDNNCHPFVRMTATDKAWTIPSHNMRAGSTVFDLTTSKQLYLPADGVGWIPGTTTTLAAGTSVTLTAPRQYFVCTGTCTVTPPAPVAGYEFCIANDDGVSTAITLSAIGSTFYGKTDRSGYGTSGGTMTATAAAGNKICIVGRDATHYTALSFTGTWTAN